jgi:competence protein ComEA
MDYESLGTKLASIFKQYWLPIIIGVLGLIFLGYGLIYLIGSSKGNDGIVFEASENSEKSVKKIMVDVEGAVVKPGVYSIDSEARVQDALISASGLSANADRDWIAKNVNLAAKVSDSTKIYIPSIGESKTILGISASNSVTAGSSGIGSGGQININSAASDELDTLPGIGPVTAGKIIDNRSYSTIDDLLSKKVISSKVFDEIKDRITAY